MNKKHYLWDSWLPRGEITLLASTAGAGKSTLALDIARRVIGHLPAPTGEPLHISTAKVVYVDTDNTLETARWFHWGLWVERLFPFKPEFDPERLIFDLDHLRQMCADIQPDLVVVDSLGGFVQGNNASKVNLTLKYLSKLAEVHNLSMLLLHHVRKASPADFALIDLRGSSTVLAHCRNVLSLRVDSNSRYLKRLKSDDLSPAAEFEQAKAEFAGRVGAAASMPAAEALPQSEVA